MNEKNEKMFCCLIIVFVLSIVFSTIITILYDRKSTENARNDTTKSERTYRELTESVEKSERITGELSETNAEFERILEEIRKENWNTK